MARVIAIGDVHGCSRALKALLEELQPGQQDTVITLGDYLDRGPDSRGVVERLLELSKRCHLIPLLGNHEEMFLSVLDGLADPIGWLRVGGAAMVESYGIVPDLTLSTADLLAAIPAQHVAFLRACRDYYETATHLFLHANYDPDLPLAEQSIATIRWLSLRDSIPPAHVSGKTAIVGHTPDRSGEILDLGYLKCLDTYCYGGGWLTALDVASGQIWQADREGNLRPRRR
jgi:serine/threonine protein phosphatase 1